MKIESALHTVPRPQVNARNGHGTSGTGGHHPANTVHKGAAKLLDGASIAVLSKRPEAERLAVALALLNGPPLNPAVADTIANVARVTKLPRWKIEAALGENRLALAALNRAWKRVSASPGLLDTSDGPFLKTSRRNLMNVPAAQNPRIAALLAELKASTRPARVALIIDATGSRQDGWDRATTLQTEMVAAAAKHGAMAIQLVHFGGDEMRKTEWISDPYTLVQYMRRIQCLAGQTMIERSLDHVKAENAREKVAAAIYVGDCIEENPRKIYAAAAGLGVPAFVFQEGGNFCTDEFGDRRRDDGGYVTVEQVFRKIARVTGGAYSKFNSNSATQLAELLKAVAVYATGGLTALANQTTEGARLLLGQMK